MTTGARWQLVHSLAVLVSAESFDHALEVARESPGLMMPGSSIEIRELAGP